MIAGFEHVLLALSEGDYRITLHGRQRMAQRKITHEDIRSCGVSGIVSQYKDEKFYINGFDCDGQELKIICVDENGILIITVI